MSRAGEEQPLAPQARASAWSLAGLLVLAVLVVVGAWRFTRESIADNRTRSTLARITTVLPPDLYDNEVQTDIAWLDTGGGEPLPVYRARRDGQPVAAVLTIDTPAGYVGPIRLLVAIRADGRLLGVAVSSHRETPGIGSVIADGSTDWLDGFPGRSLADPPAPAWTVRQDGGAFDAIAGATASSRAVVVGVRNAMQYFAAHRAEIFARQDGVPQ